MSSGQYFGPRFGALCPERGREEAGCRRVLASLYWEGPSELPHWRSSSSAPRRDSTEPCREAALCWASGQQAKAENNTFGKKMWDEKWNAAFDLSKVFEEWLEEHKEWGEDEDD